ncbi:hypothetical protein GHA01_23120 [Novacetimonas hansenii]|uniref:Uncharacterized protein n=1 Tax=Novacetimonas hansenii TaxID=436 RepID=A0ABQ0SH51_NOVHA|nr:hypothetical protein Gaha_0321_024 [Novacetimonas hansenii JCM 7643]GBQ59969.1 hypothetical protein AA0243_2195 [Novacetimonas hansenii NRIC 0243]GEC64463.1 hypothetical protein GHA01_23120 [Novacetimonas hansenii]
MSLNVGSFIEMVSGRRTKTIHETSGGAAGVFRSRRIVPAKKWARQDDGKAGRKEKEKARANVDRPDVDGTLTATRDDAAMPDAALWYRHRAVAVPPADDAHAASNRG